MEAKFADYAKSNTPTYTDYYGRTCLLTAQEIEYFQNTVALVLEKTGIKIPVYMCDYDQLPGDNGKTLGSHWVSVSGDEFITIDTYFIHEQWEIDSKGAYNITGETLVTVLCHELAHIKYQRHTINHQLLTEKYIIIVEAD